MIDSELTSYMASVYAHKLKVSSNIKKIINLMYSMIPANNNDMAAHCYTVVYVLESIGEDHDNDKITNKEMIKGYINMTEELKNIEYGTPEYKAIMKKYQKYIDMHYDANKHHPEYWLKHFNNFNLNDMPVISLIEMACDWTAAASRKGIHDPNEIVKYNFKKYNFYGQIQEQILNTIKYLVNDSSCDKSNTLIERFGFIL